MSGYKALMSWGILLACTAGITLGYGAEVQETVTDSSTKVQFPNEVSFSHEGKEYHLPITGVATRTKFFVNIYSVAHYMQDPPEGATKNAIFEAILNDSTKAKQLTLHWVRAVDVEKIRSGFLESFEKALPPEEFKTLRPSIDAFLAFFQSGTSVGDLHILRQLPGGYISLTINGKEMGYIQNPAFAKALWSIWFGSKGVVSRTKLISLLKGSPFVSGEE